MSGGEVGRGKSAARRSSGTRNTPCRFQNHAFPAVASLMQDGGFCALELAPAGACRTTVKRSGLPFARLQAALRLRPRRALSCAEARPETTVGRPADKRSTA